jgi:hypothetical protein
MVAEESPDPRQQDGAEDEGRGLTEVVEQLGRDISALLLREAELTAVRNRPAVRRGARDAIAVGVAVLAFGTAFLLANWAAVRALSGLPDWLAPLVLGLAWAIVGGVLVLALLLRSRESIGWSWWHAFVGRDDVEIVEDRERARDDALQHVRERLEELAGAVAQNAEAMVAAAVVPMAEDVGEDILDATEEAFEDVVEEIPGAGLVAEVIDFVLIPGRLGIRIMATVMKGPTGDRPRA